MWLVELSILPFIDKEARESFPKTFEEYKSAQISKSRKSTSSTEDILKKVAEIERKRGESSD